MNDDMTLAAARVERSGYRSTLEEAVALLPTPTSRDHKGQNQRADDTCLPGALALLPTPTVGDSFGARNRTSGRTNPDSQHHDGVTLTDVFYGGATPPPSPATKPSSDDLPPDLWTTLDD